MSDDLALLKRARLFDEQALAEIYDTLSPAIYVYAMRLNGDPDTAEECVSETFSRFLTALRHGQGPTDHLKAYLYRVAHNWITDRYRRARPETVLDPELRASPEMEPHIAVAGALEQQELRAALMLLTADQRQVITLKYLEELDMDEIANALQKPVGAIRALQHRALASLRHILASPAPADPDTQAASRAPNPEITGRAAAGPAQEHHSPPGPSSERAGPPASQAASSSRPAGGETR